MGEVIMVTNDLRIEIDSDDPDSPNIYVYSEGMRADGETGVVVWPNEIHRLIDALVKAAGLLAQATAQQVRG